MMFIGILVVAVGYALGTFPSAILVATRKGVDITKVGSGNPGTSNIARALGWKYGFMVFAMDLGKGAIAVAIGLIASGRPLAYVCGAASILGHMFPAQRKFKGGKGIATGGGVLIVMHPVETLIVIVIWFALLKVTKKASIGSIVVVPLVPILFALFGTPAWEIFTVIAIGALVEIRHASNIKRLLSGNEPPISGTSP
jgi:glycerol-3-phosphate acyltransferase PlsY